MTTTMKHSKGKKKTNQSPAAMNSQGSGNGGVSRVVHRRCFLRFHHRFVAVLMASLLCAGMPRSGAVRIVHPHQDEAIEFIPDIPLWVRLEKAEGECFDILLDGVSQTISCEVDTVLSAKPQPGPHRIEVVPTFRPSSHGPMASASFNVYRDESSSNIIPPSLASADG